MTLSRIIPRHFLCGADIAKTGKAMPERSEGQRDMAFTRKDDYPGKAELQVRRGVEAEFLCVHPWFPGMIPALQIPEKRLIAKRPGDLRKQWDSERFPPIDAERINRLGVVAPCRGAAFIRPPPIFAFA